MSPNLQRNSAPHAFIAWAPGFLRSVLSIDVVFMKSSSGFAELNARNAIVCPQEPRLGGNSFGHSDAANLHLLHNTIQLKETRQLPVNRQGVVKISKTRITAAAIVKELGLEANIGLINQAYRSSFLASIFIVFRVLVKSLFNRTSEARREKVALSGGVLAFSVFKNERSAIEEYVRERGEIVSHVRLDFRRATGLNFLAVLAGGSWRLPEFIYHFVRVYGLGSLRRFAYPFLGYSIFIYLRSRLDRIDPKGTVITTNTIHPISLAIHYAALCAGWRSVFLEHAMTPRIIAKDRGYSRMLLRSAHTKDMLVDLGISADAIEVLEYWKPSAGPTRRGKAKIKNLGFAVNDLDDFGVIESVISVLSQAGMNCEVRVHDADKRIRKFKDLGVRLGVTISSAAHSDILDFVKRHDTVVVGNSSVLLDCLRASVPAIYFWTGPEHLFDYYGLVAYKKLPSARNPEELLKLLMPA